MKKKFDISKHILVPKHTKISDKEKKELYEKYKISFNALPKILRTDPAVKEFNVKVGDVIKITRKSPTAGETIFYRGIVNA